MWCSCLFTMSQASSKSRSSNSSMELTKTAMNYLTTISLKNSNQTFSPQSSARIILLKKSFKMTHLNTALWKFLGIIAVGAKQLRSFLQLWPTRWENMDICLKCHSFSWNRRMRCHIWVKLATPLHSFICARTEPQGKSSRSKHLKSGSTAKNSCHNWPLLVGCQAWPSASSINGENKWVNISISWQCKMVSILILMWPHKISDSI